VTRRNRLIVSLMASAAITGAVGVGTGLAAGKVGTKGNPVKADIAKGFNTATVKASSIVFFTNVDGAPHNAVGTGVNSGAPVTGKGKRFKVKAPAKAGTYNYICQVHPNMKGKLIVVK
jgi:plastocyanin